MNHSDSIASLAAALSVAQGQIEGAKKDSANPHFKSKYADLASCWDACREALSKNGLAIVQTPGAAEGGVVEMTTMLVHKSGEWISERLTIPLQKVDAQGYGSAITYARRYALTAMVGIAPEDDDGNAASKPSGAENGRASAKIDDAQYATITTMLEKYGADTRRFLAKYQIRTVNDLPASRFKDAVDALDAYHEAKLAKASQNGEQQMEAA